MFVAIVFEWVRCSIKKVEIWGVFSHKAFYGRNYYCSTVS
jgi:hypothetical protein